MSELTELTEHHFPTPPAPVLLVCGVSGSGKTTIGTLLAKRLGWAYAEADSFHPAANVAKMAAGHLTTTPTASRG